jgi:predicted transposase/invertase (TIGR01784 family)
LKIDRFKNVVKSKIDEWMYFLKNSEIKPKFKAPGLSAANERLEYSRLDAKARRAYDKHIDNRRSENSTIYTAKLEGRAEGELVGEARGIEKGRAEGIAESILQTAKKMILEGISIDVISKVTGLSVEELAK